MVGRRLDLGESNLAVPEEKTSQISREQCRVVSGTAGIEATPEEAGVGEPKTEGAGGKAQRKVMTQTLGRMRGTSGDVGAIGLVWAT